MSQKPESAYEKRCRETFERMMRVRRETSSRQEERANRIKMEDAEAGDGSDRDVSHLQRDRSINWYKDSHLNGTRHSPRPNMMGEGMGNCLGLEGSKHSFETIKPELVELTPEEKARKRAAAVAAAAATRKRNLAKKAVIAKREESGELLRTQRVFLCEWGYDNFEERASRLGLGLPEGVDIAKTQFGTLVLVTVYEEEEGKSLGLGDPLRDPHGRTFFVPTAKREHISKVFGNVNWKRPLTQKEAEQFGVKIY